MLKGIHRPSSGRLGVHKSLTKTCHIKAAREKPWNEGKLGGQFLLSKVAWVHSCACLGVTIPLAHTHAEALLTSIGNMIKRRAGNGAI